MPYQKALKMMKHIIVFIAAPRLLRQTRAHFHHEKKSYLFIDGSNLYHGLKQNKIFGCFEYGWFYSELSKKFNIQRSFFYDAIKSLKIEPEQYAGQQKFHEKLKKQIPGLVIRHRKLKYVKVDKRVEDAKKSAGFCGSCVGKVDGFLKGETFWEKVSSKQTFFKKV